MSAINPPREILQRQGVNYDSLPLTREEKRGDYIGRKVVEVLQALSQVFIIGTVATLVYRLLSEQIARSSFESEVRLTDLGRMRLEECEEKIKEIAKRAGVADSENIKLLVAKGMGTPAAALGSATLFTSPEYLVKPEDLPSELHFSRIDSGALTEEEWVLEFNEWVDKNILGVENLFKPQSQIEVDTTLLFGKAFLRMYRDKEKHEKSFEGVVGHEVGHCTLSHTIKSSLAEFGWDLLAPLSLGISTIFKEQVFNPFHREHEVEADLFSYQNFGAEGLATFFSEYQSAGRVLHEKYPEYYDDKGGNPHDHHHPHLGERVVYLNLLEQGKEYMNPEKLFQRVRQVFA